MARYSAEKTHRKAGAARISIMVPRGTTWGLHGDYLETTVPPPSTTPSTTHSSITSSTTPSAPLVPPIVPPLVPPPVPTQNIRGDTYISDAVFSTALTTLL